MWLCYVDEAGNTGRRLDDPKQPLHLIAAILVDEAQVMPISGPSVEATNPLQSAELHAAHLLSGRGEWKGVSKEMRVRGHFGNERGTAIAIVSIRYNLAVVGYRTGIQSRYLSWRSYVDSPAQRDQLPSTCNAHFDT